MADAAEAAEQAGQQIVTFQSALIAFSNSLDACYVKYDNSHPLVVDMRTKIVNNTVLYRELHLRVSTVFVTQLKDFMESYTTLTFDDFADGIKYIAEEAASYSDQAKLVADLHTSLYEDNKQLVETAESAARKLGLEIIDTERQRDAYDAKTIRHNNKVVAGHAFATAVGVASVVAAPFTAGISLLGLAPAGVAEAYADHHGDKEDASRSSSSTAQQNLKNAHQAAAEIAGPMASCAQTFSMAIAAVSKLFNIINTEVQSYSSKAAKAAGLYAENAERGRLRLHYLKMKGPARNLVKLCGGFLAVVPQIEANLGMRARTNPSHQSYIAQWLRERETQLRLEASAGGERRRNMLQKLLSGQHQAPPVYATSSYY